MARTRHITEMTLIVNHSGTRQGDWVTCYYLAEVVHSDGGLREYVPSLDSVQRVQRAIDTYRYLNGQWVRRDHDIEIHGGWQA